MDKKTLLKVNALIFGLVAILHLARLVNGFPIVMGGMMVPLWTNIAGFFIAGFLCWQNWQAVK